MKRKAEQLEEEEEGSWNHGVVWSRGPLIGRGGFGSVYLANLKNPRSRNSCYPPVMAVKSAEVSVSSSLQKEKEVFDNLIGCPQIIKCFGEEVTTTKGREMVYNVLLEYAGGGTLAGLIKKSHGSGGFPELDVRRYTRSILEGLDYIHSRGFVHCDLKPDNILLVSGAKTGQEGQFVAKIGDFGLAKKAENGKRRKVDPYLRGTALYMAPEVVVDHVQEPPCDIWALGCIVLEMITGKSAWDLKPHVTTGELLKTIGNRFAMPKIPAEVSKEGKDFLRGCLVRNPIFRLTSEMLLDHPFVAGLEEERGGDLEEMVNVEEVDFSVPLSLIDDEDDFSSSYCSEDPSFTSEQSSSFSSWLILESDGDISSSKVVGDVHAFKPTEQLILPVSVQRCDPIYSSIPTGA
ncbi:hypothetical protein Tsubulata_028286 [Turnera subulata]|uniref:Protein kinase domain-containing protein n=1 Tax=Turnera subulata TaxID=218843 RepID=A0A9Q0FZ84_9ROSI|nr:hypothetical protein Tsubulata_028286 [Turnera subulata]